MWFVYDGNLKSCHKRADSLCVNEVFAGSRVIIELRLLINTFMNSVICRQLPLLYWRNGRRPFSKMSTSTTKFWLLKAEPDARIVKGKNVQVGFRSTYHSDCCISHWQRVCQRLKGRWLLLKQ